MKISQSEVSIIRFGKLEDNIRTPPQNIAFIYYQDDRTRLNAVTPQFITVFRERDPTTRRIGREPSSRCPFATSSRSTRAR